MRIALQPGRVVGVQALALQSHLRMALPQLGDTFPVRGGGAAVQQAGLREQQRPGADGTQPRHRWLGTAQPVQQRRIAQLRGHALATGHEQRVQARERFVGIGGLRQRLEAGRAGHRPGRFGQQAQRIGGRAALAGQLVVGRCHDLHGADHVQAHEAGVEQAGEGATGRRQGHVGKCPAMRLWLQ